MHYVMNNLWKETLTFIVLNYQGRTVIIYAFSLLNSETDQIFLSCCDFRVFLFYKSIEQNLMCLGLYINYL